MVRKLYQHLQAGCLSYKFLYAPMYCFMECISKLLLIRHRINVVNSDNFQNVIDNRLTDQPLITISNHHFCLDEALLWGTLLSVGDFFDSMFTDVNLFIGKKSHWTLTAADICFTNKLHSLFFLFFRGVPVWRNVIEPRTGNLLIRGRGIFQPSMDFCVNLINSGEWIHIYPQVNIFKMY